MLPPSKPPIPHRLPRLLEGLGWDQFAPQFAYRHKRVRCKKNNEIKIKIKKKARRHLVCLLIIFYHLFFSFYLRGTCRTYSPKILTKVYSPKQRIQLYFLVSMSMFMVLLQGCSTCYQCCHGNCGFIVS